MGTEDRSGFFYVRRQPVLFLSRGREVVVSGPAQNRPGGRQEGRKLSLFLAARGHTHMVRYQPRLEYHWCIERIRNLRRCSHVPPEVYPLLSQVNSIQLTRPPASISVNICIENAGRSITRSLAERHRFPHRILTPY